MANKAIFKGRGVSEDNTLALPNFNPRTNKYESLPLPPRSKENIIGDYNSIMNGYDNPEQTRPNQHIRAKENGTSSQSSIHANHTNANENLRNSINFFTKEAYRQVYIYLYQINLIHRCSAGVKFDVSILSILAILGAKIPFNKNTKDVLGSLDIGYPIKTKNKKSYELLE